MNPEYPIFSTTLCYLERDDAYLMLHRVKKQDDYNHDKWVGVGGKFERFESPEDCLLREVKEETGLTLTHWRSRGLLTFIWGNMTEFIHLYTADGWTGEMIQGDACREGVLEWVPKEKVEQLPIWGGDKSCSTRNIRGSLSRRRCWMGKESWVNLPKAKAFHGKAGAEYHALRRPDGGDHQARRGRCRKNPTDTRRAVRAAPERCVRPLPCGTGKRAGAGYKNQRSVYKRKGANSASIWELTAINLFSWKCRDSCRKDGVNEEHPWFLWLPQKLVYEGMSG